MPGYNKELDQIMWESERSSDGLVVRVMKYGDKGKPKLAFVTQTEDHEGEVKERRAARLFLADVEYFGAVWPEARKVMKQLLAGDASIQPIYPDEVDPDDILADQGESVYNEPE